jgi:hypothetical protein
MEMVWRGDTIKMERRMWQRLFSRENLLAFLLCLIIMLLIIMMSDSTPQWIYQGF